MLLLLGQLMLKRELLCVLAAVFYPKDLSVCSLGLVLIIPQLLCCGIFICLSRCMYVVNSGKILTIPMAGIHVIPYPNPNHFLMILRCCPPCTSVTEHIE